MDEQFAGKMWAYMNSLRGTMNIEDALVGAMLVAEMKMKYKQKSLSKEDAYESMLLVADELHTANPFKSQDDFYRAFLQMDDAPDWEALLYNALKYERMGLIITPEVLLSQMTTFIKGSTKTVLIAEAEKFVPHLKATVDEHISCEFTLTSSNALFARIIERMFVDYENVTVINTNIYSYGFLNEKYDLILSVPTFGGRDLANDLSNFMCREYDMVALENLLLHIAPTGRLVIVMPARITFAGGRVNDLRKFVMQMYKLEEIAELPDGIFQNTGIKTFLIVISDGRTEDVIVRSYEAAGRKTKRGPVESLELTDDTFVMVEELEEIGDWNIDKLLAKQDEEFMRYQASDRRKIQLGEVAEIFRGKSVTKKDASGSIGVVNISNIGQYEIDYNSMDKLDEEERKVQNYILQDGDVVLPARGTAIRTAVFREQSYPCIASSNVIVIRPKSDLISSTYLKLFIDSPIGNSMISSLQQGMTVMNISYKDLKLLEVPFPTLEEQEIVANEYEQAYQNYIETISTAEKQWKETLNRLQDF
ncbi:restriction endonuclease subunit S [Ruminococcus sp.]|uniref:restriction endonuclease subunit S n=1 Tax=Ruminococcus sp. TaxID=41978 RepID=UPI0025DADC3C|nr:restriction endonuclease subunit S [Ruminococcus sp.]MCR4638245.1 restriction endonuclease subunit S [Ruminococcus sp.]